VKGEQKSRLDRVMHQPMRVPPMSAVQHPRQFISYTFAGSLFDPREVRRGAMAV
jgi:hypothetical protein